MQRLTIVKGRSLGGSSDLTLLAPIRTGFVESLESVTYKTRIKRVLDILHASRLQAHEYHMARLLSDSVERVGAILSVRVAVLEPEDNVLLSVSFDGSWESYVRVLWDKVGTLLDLIFCGTVGYVTSQDHSFDEWRAWAMRVQVETGFYYGPPESTARDLLYHRRVEAMEMRGAGGDLNQVRARVPSAEQAVQHIVHPSSAEPAADDPPYVRPTHGIAQYERVRSGLQGLMALYRLANLHRPGTADGEVLRRAAIDLLLEFIHLWKDGLILQEIDEARSTRFGLALDWLFPQRVPYLNIRDIPPDPANSPNPIPAAVLSAIQGGIVRAYPMVTHGALLLLAFPDPQAAARCLDWLAEHVTRGNDAAPATPDKPYCNVGFTAAGLRAAGMAEDTLALFPEEFRQGMAARAGLLGDVRNNHPSRWRLPVRLGAKRGAHSPRDLVGMDAVHAVVQLRVLAANGTDSDVGWQNAKHPLHAFIRAFRKANAASLLAVQGLARRFKADKVTVEEHFGYADAMGQPELEPGGPGGDVNRVHLGEVLLGYANASDKAPDANDLTLPEPERQRLEWMHNGSFAVVRKYRQYPDRLAAAVQRAVQQVHAAFGGNLADHEDAVYAKLMGRKRSGEALIASTPQNAFTYAADPDGRSCPLQSHIRLANPREAKPAHGAGRPPRVMRRSMSYGPVSAGAGSQVERGLLFMAYNASLGEQFEVVQRWLAGANGSGSSSARGCPMLGVPHDGLVRHFRFELEHPTTHEPHVFTVELDSPQPLFEETAAPTRLEWGLYLFVSSLRSLARLRHLARCAAECTGAAPWQVSQGRRQLAELQRIEDQQEAAVAAQAWKAALEDPVAVDRLESAGLWAAIREDHGGVLRTPYGVVVADRSLLHEVLLDRHRRYSIVGQRERMRECFGDDIFLGLDAGPQYDAESTPVNQAIGDLSATDAARQACFELARDAATAKLQAILEEAIDNAQNVYALRYEVGFDVREAFDDVIVALCNEWFGLENSPHFHAGSTDWAWKDEQPPRYPGHFTALSRYMFQPNPGAMPAGLARRYGKGLVRAMKGFVDDHSMPPTLPDGSAAPIAAAVYKASSDSGWRARTMVGVMMGFTAPLLGSLANVMREWQADGTFSALRVRLAGRQTWAEAKELLEAHMVAAMRMRPMPPLIWRTATVGHHLGHSGQEGVAIDAGDKLVLGLMSGSQQSLTDRQDDGRLMFGGERKKPHEPHPTHACPGYTVAIDAMLGAMTALLVRPEELVHGASPLGLITRGTCPDPESAQRALTLALAHASPPEALPAAMFRTPPPSSPTGRVGLIVAMGDSWVSAPGFHIRSDLRLALKKFGWTIPNEPPHALCDWQAWGRAESLHRDLKIVGDALEAIIQQATSALPLRAVLISAGGNDSTGTVFENLLVPNDANPATSPLCAGLLDAHMKSLKGMYADIIRRVKEKLVAKSLDVPIIVQGYDYSQLPVFAGLKSWFRRPLERKNYLQAKHRPDQLAALRDLIKDFNKKLAELAAEPEFKPYVRYVPLVDTIAAYWNDPMDAWVDDLHVSVEAYRVLGVRIDEEIMKPYP